MKDNKKAMRKLKLHVGMSIDGCIAGPNNEMDWIDFSWNESSENLKTGSMTQLIPFSWEEK